MTLKQGFGRLIRTQRDAGIVAILDRRIVRKGYGRALLAGLPPARASGRWTSCTAFWEGIADEQLAKAPESLAPRPWLSPLSSSC